MIILLKYKGKSELAFDHGSVYKAKKVNDEGMEGYFIFDEAYDWYWYPLNYVKENFDIVKE